MTALQWVHTTKAKLSPGFCHQKSSTCMWNWTTCGCREYETVVPESIMSWHKPSIYSVWYLSRSGNVTYYVIERLGQGNESAFFCKFLSCLKADVQAVFYPHAVTRPDGWLWPLCLPSVIKNLRIHVTIVRLRCFLTCTGVDLTPMVQVSNYR